MRTWISETQRAILAANSGGESYRKMAIRLGLPEHKGTWLCDVARGKSEPTRKLARMFGIEPEQDDDIVKFAARMTRAQRDELQAAIDASGMTRLEWLQAAAAETMARDILQEILRWCNAYPLGVFPEPDFKHVRELLAAGGISLDSVSASNMRHVLEGIAEIAKRGIE